MLKSDDLLDIIDQSITACVNDGSLLITLDDVPLNGRTFHVHGHELINFGSCSYLGLEMNPRLKAGAIDAVKRYGAQFSSSRIFASIPLYAQLEGLLSEVFTAPVIVTPTTTLGHISALPVLIHKDDVILMDRQVHTSVQTAAALVANQGVPVEVMRHNHMALLEERLAEHHKHQRRIWYLADGVYSMYGDFAPVDTLFRLLEKYEQLHIYVDDAHGMSWTGDQGRGSILGTRPIHERMVVALSLSKAFGAGGGVLVFPNEEWARKVRILGGPMLFSGPLQPAVLGAAVASAKLHLSSKINLLQQALQKRIAHCNACLRAQKLPVISYSNTPIRFLGLGRKEITQAMAKRLMAQGYYTNIAMFPSVPERRSGLRFALTLHHSLEDITQFVETFADVLPQVLAEKGSTRVQIDEAFNLPSTP